MSSNPSVTVPIDILENLKCAHCLLLLSVGPIMYNRDRKLVCGRCADQMPSDNWLVQAEGFETVAQLLLFPCSYVKDGCPENKLKWHYVDRHEITCSYRPQTCPLMFSENCEWLGNPRKLVEHFTEKHLFSLLKSDGFRFTVMPKTKIFKLIPQKPEVFLLQIAMELTSIQFGVLHVNAQPATTNSRTYDLELKNPENNKTFTFNSNVNSIYDMKYERIDIDCITGILDTTEVACTIKILDTKKEGDDKNRNVPGTSASGRTIEFAITKDLLNELECPICNDHMLPPIFVCPHGHSICHECKMKVSHCPSCRTPFRNARNYVLERITDHINYPCKNASFGCNFLGNSNAISEHNLNCGVNGLKCPLKESEQCKWVGITDDLLSHLTNNHPQKTWTTCENYLNRDLASLVFVDFNVMVHEGQFFKICCKHEPSRAGFVFWAFQHLGLARNELSPYKMEIEFLDQVGLGGKLIINASCQRETNNMDVFENALTISYDLLKPFIDSKNLILQRHIRIKDN